MNLFNISTFIIGTIYSIINFLYVILNIPLGIIVDKIGSKNALVISALIAVPLFLIMGLHIVLFFIISFLIFESIIRIINSLGIHKFILDYQNAGEAFGVFSLITSILASIGILTGGFLLQHFGVSSSLFILVSILFGISSLIRFLKLPKSKNSTYNSSKIIQLSFKYIKDKGMLLYILVSMLSSVLNLEAFYVTIYFVKYLSISLILIGIMYSSYAIIMAFLPLLFSIILSNHSKFKNLAIILSFESFIFFLIPLLYNIYIVFMLFYLWAFLVAMQNIIDFNIGKNVTRSEIRGSQIALINTFTNIFQIFYNIVVGLLFDVNPLYSFYLSGILGIISVSTIILFVLMFKV
jgi:MFS family permease